MLSWPHSASASRAKVGSTASALSSSSVSSWHCTGLCFQFSSCNQLYTRRSKVKNLPDPLRNGPVLLALLGQYALHPERLQSRHGVLVTTRSSSESIGMLVGSEFKALHWQVLIHSISVLPPLQRQRNFESPHICRHPLAGDFPADHLVLHNRQDLW